MAVVASGERDGARRTLLYGSGSHERVFWVQVDDLDSVTADLTTWVNSNVSTTHDFYILRNVTAEELEGSYLLELTATYEPPQANNVNPPGAGEARYHIRSSGEETTIFRARSTINRYVPAGKTAKTYAGIGDDGKKLGGAPVVFPKFGFGYEYTVTSSNATTVYIGKLAAAVGSVNSDAWKGYSIGEVLLKDVTGQITVGADSTITLEFAYSPNEASVTFPGITPFAKKGWEYLDIHTKTKVDGGIVLTEVMQVDVLQLYPTTAFSELGLP